MMGCMKKLLLALTSLTVLLGACANETGSPQISPRAAVLDAMTAVYEAGTVHEEFEMSMSAGGERFTFSGEGDVDSENQRFSMSMDLGMLGGRMDMIMDGGVMYMRAPTLQDIGTEWISMDPSKMDPAAAAQFGGLGGGTMDPSAYAGLFAGVVHVKAAGRQEIGGVATTHFTGTIDLKKVLAGFADIMGEEADRATRDQLELALEQFNALGLDQELPFEVWIDDDGFPRRERFSMDFGSLVPGAGDASMEMTVDFSDFGEPVDIDVPHKSQVTDMTDMLRGADAASGVYG